jgi:hypothetical protein
MGYRVGMLCLGLIYRAALLVLGVWYTIEPIHSLSWIGWVVFAGALWVMTFALTFVSMHLRARRRFMKFMKIRATIPPEDMRRFEEINSLHLTSDPAERERLMALGREYQNRIREALKK